MIEKDIVAPDFCLKDQNNKEICLQNFKGKWVVLYFYPKDNTPGCTLEAKNFSNSISDFKNNNAEIIGISPDSLDSHKNFEDKHNLSITLLSDQDHEILKKYGVWQKKKMYGKEFMGVIRSTFLISPEGRIVHVWPKVKVAGHIEEVLNILEEKKNE